QDGDGRPDILLGNGFHGLRLYRNKGAANVEPPLALGPWHFVGPFPNKEGLGFMTIFGPEKKVDLKAKYKGKSGDITWREGRFADGEVNSLALFQENTEAVVYLYREIHTDRERDMPISLGSDDGLVAWHNGKRIVSQNVTRACAPDQAKVTLKLRKGVN